MGIYFFEIKKNTSVDFSEWIEKFKLKFRGEKKEFLHKFTPNIIEKRVSYHLKQENSEWVPFYIGKSKDIKKRVSDHIETTLGKPPFALKLLGRRNLIDETFRLSYIPIKVTNYDVIVPLVEKTLRDLKNPIVGKQ